MSERHDETLREFFIPENRQADTIESHVSPSGKYLLEIVEYASPNRSHGSQGVVKSGGRTIAAVNRNYGHFPFAWAEQHPVGHDYLICGEDYMGQTVIELDTGERRDYVNADEGFCCVEYSVSPHRQFVAVHGCYWACPFELWVVDMAQPLALPYKKLWEGHHDRSVRKFTWNDDNSLEVLYAVDYSPALRKTTEKMTKEERAAHYESKNGNCWRVRANWRYPDKEQVLETHDLGARNAEGFDQNFAWNWKNWDDTSEKLHRPEEI